MIYKQKAKSWLECLMSELKLQFRPKPKWLRTPKRVLKIKGG